MNGTPARHETHAACSGQTLIEFALVLPVFLIVLFGLIDMGRFVYTDSVLSQSAREGARLAAVEASWVASTDLSCGATGGPVCPADHSTLKAWVSTAVNRMVGGVGTITAIYVSCTQDNAEPSGNWTAESTCDSNTAKPDQAHVVSVHVRYTFRPMTPIITQLIGGSVERDAFATMVIN